MSYGTEYTYWPVCPHCGQGYDSWWDGHGFAEDGDAVVLECGQCEGEFEATIHIEPLFCTKIVDEGYRRRVRIRTARIARGETQRAAAKRLGVSSYYYSKMEVP